MRTLLTDGGGGVSGGQRQRILIARAVAARPRILIFDEATSALDNVTQRAVSDSLGALGCTRVVVAHRLSTIRNCDRVVVIDDGHIVEDGTYDELMGAGSSRGWSSGSGPRRRPRPGATGLARSGRRSSACRRRR